MSIRTLLIATASVASLGAMTTPVLAQDTEVINVSLNMPILCDIQNEPNNIVVTPSTNTTQGDPNFGEANESGFTESYDDGAGTATLFCNAASSFSVSATPLVNTIATSDNSEAVGFTDTVDYSVLLSGGREQDRTSAVYGASSGGSSQPTKGDGSIAPSTFDYGVYRGDLQIDLVDYQLRGANAEALRAGTYNGQVTLTITPTA